ncbi:hypothetical protein QEZ47_11820 [Aminobacter anthyllidis]|uniref:hypothetical protein n=1 Tax=Aminobacter anthyllidis TaxID=1035067 RepID=UPI0024570D97|nr:hypothetical protein [Aminobacter anthyllidis]MDH4986209.1 hypothetical protein [Aminobacter anthyllidis]
MAVINAHTPDATKARQAERLQTAMTALIGPAARDGQDIERALLFMRRQRQRDVCDVEMQALHLCSGAPRCATRTILELATLAAREVLGCATTGEVQLTARLLCRMFRSQGISFEVWPDQAREALGR